MLELDDLQLYMGESLKVSDKITLRQIKLRDIVDLGERQYGEVIHLFTAIPSDYKSMLWDIGIDWMDISDFDFFCLMLHMFTPSLAQTSLIFGDLDFAELKLGADEAGSTALYDKNDEIVIDSAIHKVISNFVCRCNGVTPKVEKAGNKATKEFLIREDRERRARALERPRDRESSMQSLISSLVNSAEFKYNLSEVMDLTLLQLRDSALRISTIRMATVVYNGLYAQGIDSEKLDKSLLDWMRPLQK